MCRIHGKENIQTEEFLREVNRGLIIASNHESYIDIPVLMALFPVQRPIHFIAKNDLFRIPFIHLFFRFAFIIPIDRQKNRFTSENRHFLRTAIDILQQRKTIGIFPEGGIARKDAKRGIVALAKRTPVFILPIKLIVKPWFHIWDNIPIGTYTVFCGAPLILDDLRGDRNEQARSLLEKIRNL